ncbi:MAG: CgeB family protein [Thermoflexibacteraceae bacterium]|jgi:spore maturation protein CgeB
MRILYAGELSSVEINCYLRMRTLQQMGYEIIPFDFYAYQAKGLEGKIQFHFGWGRNINKLNKDLLVLADSTRPDLIWIDKGIYVRDNTLVQLKKHLPNTYITHLVPDDPFGYNRKGWDIFYKAIRHYDLHFVKRPHNVAEYKVVGAKKVFEYDHSYDSTIHQPMKLSPEEYAKYHAKVGFIGTCETQRADMLRYLVKNGVEIAIWGKYWDRYKHWHELKPFYKGYELHGVEYAKVLSGIEIVLHFLRKANRDAQDSRTFEIPACGAFMLAERTYKHLEFFEEDKEAVFFDTQEELMTKLIYYQQNPEQRKAIALAGHLRSLRSGYDHRSRLTQLLGIVQRELFGQVNILTTLDKSMHITKNPIS